MGLLMLSGENKRYRIAQLCEVTNKDRGKETSDLLRDAGEVMLDTTEVTRWEKWESR